jgi:hypothetical protein
MRKRKRKRKSINININININNNNSSKRQSQKLKQIQIQIQIQSQRQRKRQCATTRLVHPLLPATAAAALSTETLSCSSFERRYSISTYLHLQRFPERYCG